MIRKVVSLLIFTGIVVIAITQRTWFTEIIKSGGDVAVALSILFTTICAFVQELGLQLQQLLEAPMGSGQEQPLF